MRQSDTMPTRLRRTLKLGAWLSAVAVGGFSLAFFGLHFAIEEALGGTDQPKFLAAIKRDPMAFYVPPLAVGSRARIETEDGAALGFRTMAGVHLSYAVQRSDARLSFAAAVRAARDAGWQTRRLRWTAPDPGRLDAVESTVPAAALREYGLRLSMDLRRYPGGARAGGTSYVLSIDITGP